MPTDRSSRACAHAALVVGAVLVAAAASRAASGQDEAALLSQYNLMREHVRPTADSHWRLAQWCAEHGLKAEAEVHSSEVVRLDPKRDAAWRKLGFKKQGGRWMSDAQIAAEKLQREANKVWGPRLQKLHDALHDPKTHDIAVAELAKIDEPAAVPSVWNVFAGGGTADQLIAVQLLGQIRSPASSQLLATLAVFAPSATVRGRATETLRGRDPDEYASGLISLIRQPSRYEMRPLQGAGSTGALFVEGEKADFRRFYSAPSPEMKEFWGPLPWMFPLNPYGNYAVDVYMKDASKSPVAFLAAQMVMQAVWQENQLEAARATAASREQMASDVALVESRNALIREMNERITLILRTTVGSADGKSPASRDDAAAWTAWLEASKGRTAPRAGRSQRRPKPVIDEFVPLNYVPTFVNVLHHFT
jgi:hypothetical protein